MKLWTKLGCFGRSVEIEFGAAGEAEEGSFHWDVFGYCDDLSIIKIVEDPRVFMLAYKNIYIGSLILVGVVKLLDVLMVE